MLSIVYVSPTVVHDLKSRTHGHTHIDGMNAGSPAGQPWWFRLSLIEGRPPGRKGGHSQPLKINQFARDEHLSETAAGGPCARDSGLSIKVVSCARGDQLVHSRTHLPQSEIFSLWAESTLTWRTQVSLEIVSRKFDLAFFIPFRRGKEEKACCISSQPKFQSLGAWLWSRGRSARGLGLDVPLPNTTVEISVE